MRFFLFDRILTAESGRRMEAVKLVNLQDGFFACHYPRKAVMPATMLVEAMAQVGGMLNFLTHDFAVEMVLALVDGVRFGRSVVQGDLLMIHVEMMRDHPYGATMRGGVHIDGDEVAASDRIVFAHEEATDPATILLNRKRFAYQGGGWGDAIRETP